MTREEAIEIINRENDPNDTKVWEVFPEYREALDMALKALSQEPCDDTVSIRKDALKTRVGNIVAYNVEWLKKHWQMEMDIVCGVEPCTDAVSREDVLNGLRGCICDEWVKTLFATMVKQLPSVTQKSGKWNEYYTSQKGNDVFNCKECGHTFVVTQGKDNMNFCPNCGAKMESEDKK